MGFWCRMQQYKLSEGSLQPLRVLSELSVLLTTSSRDSDTESKWHRVKTTSDITGRVSLPRAPAALRFLSSLVSGSCDASSLCACFIPAQLFNRGVPWWRRASALWCYDYKFDGIQAAAVVSISQSQFYSLFNVAASTTGWNGIS